MKVYLIGNAFNGYAKIGKADYPDFRVEDLDKPKLPFTVWVLAAVKRAEEAERDN